MSSDTATPAVPETTTVVFGGTRYAFGLTWRILAGVASKTAADEARDMAAELRPTGTFFTDSAKRRLCGFASDNSARGAHSAAVLASGFPKRRLIVLRLTDTLLWVCIAGEGTLDVDSDVVVDLPRAEALVQAAITQAMSKSKDLELAIGPDTRIESPWLEGVPPTAPELILLLREGAPSRLRNLTPVSLRKKLILSAAVLLPLAWATLEYQAHTARKEAARAALELAAAERNEAAALAENSALRDAAMRQAIVDALSGDTSSAAPIAAYEACKAAVQPFAHGIAGWRVLSMRCEPIVKLVTLDVAIQHPAGPDYGTPESLASAVSAHGGSASIDPSLHSATVSLPLGSTTKRPAVSSPDALPTWQDFIEGAGTTLLRRSRGQPAFSYTIAPPAPRTIHFTDPTAASVDGGPVRVEVPPESTYREARVDVTAPFGASDVVSRLSDINTRLTAVVLDAQRSSVTLSLVVLVQP